MAEILEMHASHYNAVESARNKPSVVKLYGLSVIHGITLDELITGVKPGDPEEIAVLKIAEREIDLLKREKALLEKGA